MEIQAEELEDGPGNFAESRHGTPKANDQMEFKILRFLGRRQKRIKTWQGETVF